MTDREKRDLYHEFIAPVLIGVVALVGIGIATAADPARELARAVGAGIFLWALVQAGEWCERGARREGGHDGE